MPPQEIDEWRAFYVRWPFDDLHRYHRPAALVAACLGGDFQQHLDLLQPPPQLITESDPVRFAIKKAQR
jgi:hypothetical protein